MADPPVARLQSLECKICSEAYTEDGGDRTPLTLNCGHSLCRKCVAKLWKQSGTRTVQCPFDRSEQLVRDLNDVPKSYGLIEVISELREQAGERAPLPAQLERAISRPLYHRAEDSGTSMGTPAGPATAMRLRRMNQRPTPTIQQLHPYLNMESILRDAIQERIARREQRMEALQARRAQVREARRSEGA